jgi:O-antigen ligase
MQDFLEKFDGLAGIQTERGFARLLERAAFVFLVLMVLAAPHSIAATQTAWLLGITITAVRLFFSPRPQLARTPLDAALWAFFGWSLVSAAASYAPDISMDRLRGVMLFLIFYFVVNNLRTKRAALFLAMAIVFSCMVNVVWTPIERIAGRGVEMHGISPNGPMDTMVLAETGDRIKMQDGDTIYQANGRKVRSPEEVTEEIESRESSVLVVSRLDSYLTIEIRRNSLLPGTTAVEKLGIANWNPNRVWRATGFYNHWTTYSEVLQIIASLTLGFLAALFLAGIKSAEFSWSRFLLFAISLAGMLLALLLTTTRASQAAFFVSAFAIVLLTGKGKLIFSTVAIALPLALIGFIYLQQTRKVGVVDSADGSTQYRLMMYRDGMRLWTSSPRNFIFGVGMDSVKRYWPDWHMFDNGWQPMGHFHSEPVQLVVERGLPALLFWLWVLWKYGRSLWRYYRARSKTVDNSFDWREKGLILGSFGGLVGFFTGGLVHNNLGDSEVAMVFYIVMGLSIGLMKQHAPRLPDRTAQVLGTGLAA